MNADASTRPTLRPIADYAAVPGDGPRQYLRATNAPPTKAERDAAVTLQRKALRPSDIADEMQGVPLEILLTMIQTGTTAYDVGRLVLNVVSAALGRAADHQLTTRRAGAVSAEAAAWLAVRGTVVRP